LQREVIVMRSNTIWRDEAMSLYPREENQEFELSAERERRAFMEGVMFSASKFIVASMDSDTSAAVLLALQEQVDACHTDDCEMCHRHKTIISKATTA
jgi:hypothetical protein